MRRWLIFLCVLAQILVLGFMAGGREMVIAKGQIIYLRTAPIDPRDPFRGDFVRLSYPFNTVPGRDIEISGQERVLKKSQIVYAELREHDGGYYEFERLTDIRPVSGMFIKGRVTREWDSTRSEPVFVKYGIEQLFVEQGAGREIEDRRGIRGGMQVPMEIEVAVSSGGVAVLKDFRWSQLGMQLEVVRFNPFDGNPSAEAIVGTTPLSPAVRVTLQNVSEVPLLLSNPGEDCGFYLVPTMRSSAMYSSVAPACHNLSSVQMRPIRLDPQQQYSVDLDLSEARWTMQTEITGGEQVIGEIGKIAENQMFRVVYRPIKLLAEAGEIPLWLGDLASQSFNARGRID